MGSVPSFIVVEVVVRKGVVDCVVDWVVVGASEVTFCSELIYKRSLFNASLK